jgi:hypothetical protein
MPKASCQIDAQGGRTGLSIFLATVAARDAAFLAGDAAAGAARDTRRAVHNAGHNAGHNQAVIADMSCRLHPSDQSRLLFHRHKGET